MPTQGPWGSGPTGNNGGGGLGNGGGRRPPRGGGTPPGPDIDDLIRKGQERVRDLFPGGDGNKKGFFLLFLVLLLLWASSGIYRVEPDEQGVVLRFGQYHNTTGPGLRYHLPVPIEEVLKPRVTSINREEIGYRSPPMAGMSERLERSIPEESLMLTGDENIIDINFEVQWKIKDAKNFLFNVRNPSIAVRNAAESAMREVIGHSDISKALAEGRLEIELAARKLLQETLDAYGAGIEIVLLQMLKSDPPSDVIDAFRDVQTAKADQERLINEAQSYRNDILPKARGQAEQVLQDADAYKQQVVAHAQGEAARFMSVYEEYKKAKDVTRKRMYIDTMENILGGMDKIIIDQKSGNGVVPYLPLPELKKRSESEPESGGN
ncbi:MAG: FtsH protease activity modulator HflK [Alphaproteobacteria bacterium]|nr:FtsH protease activity modulator HflK [Alphaproteobacteria bacterium]